MSTVNDHDEQAFWTAAMESVDEHLAVDEQEGTNDLSPADAAAGRIVFQLAGGEQVDATGFLEFFQDRQPWQSMGRLPFSARARLVDVATVRTAKTAMSAAGFEYHPLAFAGLGSISEADDPDGRVAWQFLPPKGTEASTVHWMWVDLTDGCPQLLHSNARAISLFVDEMTGRGITGFCLEFHVFSDNRKPARRQVCGEWVNDPTRPDQIQWGRWVRGVDGEWEYETCLVRYRSFREPNEALADRVRYLRARRALTEASSEGLDHSPEANPDRGSQYDSIV